MNRKSIYLSLTWAIMLVVMGTSPLYSQDRERKFDLSKWLSDRDKNQSGVLEQNELDDRTKKFLNGMKIDTSGSVVIADVIRTSNAARQKMEKEKADKEFASQTWEIPGFGEPVSKDTVPGFGVESNDKEDEVAVLGFEIDTETTKEAMISIKEQFGRRINDRVESVFRTYDKNKNQILDPAEIAGIPWRDPPWKPFDENRDGQLTKVELAKRYKSIEGDDDRERNRRVVVNRNQDSKDNSSKRKTETTKRPANDKSSARRALDYANSTLKSKDKNGNGKIDGEDEMKSVGILKKADTDKNGEITRDELIAFASGGSKSSGSSTSGSTASGSENPRIRRRRVRDNDFAESKSRRRSGSTDDRIIRDGTPQQTFKESAEERKPFKDDSIANRRQRVPSDFKSKDKNSNGMIELTEFVSEITSESIKKFQGKDANEDGVITPDEWRN